MVTLKTEPKPISVGNRTEITEIFRFGFGFNRKTEISLFYIKFNFFVHFQHIKLHILY